MNSTIVSPAMYDDTDATRKQQCSPGSIWTVNRLLQDPTDLEFSTPLYNLSVFGRITALRLSRSLILSACVSLCAGNGKHYILCLLVKPSEIAHANRMTCHRSYATRQGRPAVAMKERRTQDHRRRYPDRHHLPR